MCIIGVYRKGAIVEERELENMWKGNEDGAGFSLYNRETGRWDTIKGLMSLEEVKSILNEKGILNNVLDTTFVIHFRAATHGGIRKSLTHPFRIKTSDEKEVLLYHNGVFSITRNYLLYRGIDEYEACGISYGRRTYANIYAYDDYSQHLKVEEDVGVEEIPLDPDKLQSHSDTSLVALLVSELSIPSNSVVKLFNSPLMKEVVSSSRVCLCIEGNEEPFLIGSWVKEGELKMFSNYGYKDFYSRYGYKSNYSSIYSYKNDAAAYYKDEDYKSTFNESEKICEISCEDKELDKRDYYKISLGNTTGIIFPVNSEFEAFIPVYYSGKSSEVSEFICDYEVVLTEDRTLYVKIEQEFYPVYFLSESQEKYLKKYNLKKKIGIAVDEKFNFYFVQKSKNSGKFKLQPVKKPLENPVPGYFYHSEENSIEAIEKYYLIESRR